MDILGQVIDLKITQSAGADEPARLVMLVRLVMPVRLVRLVRLWPDHFLCLANDQLLGNRVVSYTYLNARNRQRQPVLSYDRWSDCKFDSTTEP